ncbi:aspartic peptidase domain-containing protein, partial [Suillus spraguei]
LALLALSITGSTVEVRNSRITFPMTRRLKFSNSTNIVQHDEARVAALMDYSTHGRRINVPGLESTHFTYLISVYIGDPPRVYKLIVDTSSAITWVGANSQYMPTSISFNTRQPIEKDYGPVSFNGIRWTDTVSLGYGATVTRMSIGVASDSRGMADDGILGIGPVGLTSGTLRNHPEETFSTITGHLYAQRVINQPLVGIFFQPNDRYSIDVGGELSFGEPNRALYRDNIGYTPITLTYPSSAYWGIDQRITYDSTDILDLSAGIIDTSSTFIWLASNAYDRYQATTGANLDAATNLLTITISQYRALRNLDFHIGQETYHLTPDAQIWPRYLNSAIRGDRRAIYLVVKGLSRPIGQGLDFLLGYVFLQRFYTVLDSGGRVGFAKTSFTYAVTN